MSSSWSEEYRGGSPEAERLEFQQLAREMMLVQLKNRKKTGRPVDRGFQAKTTFAATNAELRFRDDLAADLTVGFAQPGAVYRTIVRFSNASGLRNDPDYKGDLRSAALRVVVSEEEQHDLTFTNYPVAHAKDAREFVKFAVATAGGTFDRVLGVAKLVFICGPRPTLRMVTTILKGQRHRVRSIANESYYSRLPMRWGDQAVQYHLRPAPGTALGPEPSRTDPDYLTHEALARGRFTYELCVQRFVSPRKTPIEDASVAWATSDAPVEVVGLLTVDPPDAEGAAVEKLAFNPWNTTEEFRPLGNLNRVRKVAYDTSAAHRKGFVWREDPPPRNVVLGGLVRKVFAAVNRWVPWHRLSQRLALLNLDGIRYTLRQQNLVDTEVREAPPAVRRVPPEPTEEVRARRTYEGTWNDLSDREMGSVGATFGRNMRTELRPESFDEPNPVTISRELLYRETFQPATSLNLLAAAWIQFQVHDWVNHARHPLGVDDVRVDLPAGADDWRNTPGGPAERQMRIAGNIPGGAGPVNFANTASHWWDGSEVYGNESEKAQSLREGAKIRLTPAGYLPDDVNGQEITGFAESWWLGLSAMHTLFAREHNLLCDKLAAEYLDWSPDRIYHTARLIVSALIAKIHTVEWTPGILATKVLKVGMSANWYGPEPGDWMTKAGMWLLDAHALKGIPETLPDHHGVPYSLTEEFTTVYRMHPLIPDEYVFVDHRHGNELLKTDFARIQGTDADDALRELGLTDVLYSFGIANPGAIKLHNYPRALQGFERDGERIDLSVVDLVRVRRRGVPRYNDFREALHMPRITRWEDLSDDPESVARLRKVYRSVDDVDTMIGLFAETPPKGFGFSDTAFRIFILMASRRLQSDRFLTVDFRPEVYSPLGMEWIAKSGMREVILRHAPELADAMPAEGNPFAPWQKVGGAS